jgi:CRP-like cAMP-binding protein
MLELISLPVKYLVHPAGQGVEYVYFPGDGFCSELTVLTDGTMVEVATIGREGMTGLLRTGESGSVTSATMVQGAMATCYKMSADAFQHEMERSEAFANLLTRYRHALTRYIMQSTACNAVHSIEQRLARWLLMAHDHMGTNAFPLTQEFVAIMLGASRPAVTIAAGILQKAGLITYRQGHVTISDRKRLETAACECYRVTARVLRDVTAGSQWRRA